MLLGFGLALVGGLILWVIIPWAVDIPATVKISSLSPAFWPKILSWALMVFGLLLAAQNAFGKSRSEEAPRKPEDLIPETEDCKQGIFERLAKPARAAVAMFGMLAYYFLVQPLGIIIASIIVLPGFAVLYGEKRWRYLVPISVLLPLALYYFFTKAAHKPMPTGYLF